jgi:PAS domain S-box-containing protein
MIVSRDDGRPPSADLPHRVFDVAPIAMVVVDALGRIVMANHAAETTFGYAPSGVVGLSAATVLPEWGQRLDGAPGEATLRLERAVRRDGSAVDAEISVTSLVTAAGAFRVATIMDLSSHHASETRFRLALDAAPNAMIMIDGHGRIVLTNRHAEALFGYSPGGLLGRPIECLLPESVQQAHRQSVARYLSAPSARAMGNSRPFVGIRADGGAVPLEVGLNPIETPDGPCVLASIIDVSDRKRAEDQLRLLVEAAPGPMLMIDAESRVTGINQRCCDLFRRPREELDGAQVISLIPDFWRLAGAARASLLPAASSEAPHGVWPTADGADYIVARRGDGSTIPVEVAVHPITLTPATAFLVSVVDVSEKRRDESLKRQLVALVESSEDAIIGVQLDGEIISWNGGAERMFGYSHTAAVGRTMQLIVPPALFDEEAALMARVARDEPVSHYVTRRLRADGHTFDVSVTLSPIHGPTGAVVGASFIARDITDSRRRDAELQRSNAELEQFAYVASHDLQEPLRMVANYTELLRKRYEGKLDEKADKYIFYASDGAKRMQRLVADLLAYSRVGSQGKPLVPVDAADVVGHVVRSLRAVFAESGAEIDIGPLPIIPADEGQLSQLFQNLIENAIKFRSAEAPRIVVSAERSREHWHFSVADNGIGMEMQYADRIFQMFQRLHEIGRYPGSGIGLAIAKRIVDRHGGRIWVDSSLGRGSVFQFTLRALEDGVP